MNFQGYKLRLKSRAETKHQSTRHQEYAAETAEKLEDLPSIGIYMKVFKEHRDHIDALIRCRAWVLAHATGNKGRMFVAIYKKFIR